MALKNIPASSAKTRKKAPLSYGAAMLCKTKSGLIFYIVSSQTPGLHTLWEQKNGEYVELAQSESPNELSNLIPWNS